MTISFFSNFFNHHQKPLCDAFCKIASVEFTFVATIEMPQNFKDAGYEVPNTNYVLESHLSPSHHERAMKLIEDSDVIIFGSVRDDLFTNRIKANKLTFRYSERVFRKPWHIFDPRRIYHLIKHNTVYRNKKYYLLCAGGFVANDYAKVLSFPNKMLKWGYFTQVENHSIENIIALKDKDIFKILFVGRLIPLKNPEIIIDLASKLKRQGIKFSIEYIGVGPLMAKLKHLTKLNALQDYIKFTGNVTNSVVLNKMRKSHVLIFPSNKEEGWGAVCNEALANGCALVCTNQVGAAPFLINPHKNGMVYRNNDITSLFDVIFKLFSDSLGYNRMIRAGYFTMSNIWSPDNAVRNFIAFCDNIENSEIEIVEGPCAYAKPLTFNWYR